MGFVRRSLRLVWCRRLGVLFFGGVLVRLNGGACSMFMLRRCRACGEDYIEWRSQLDVYIFVRILLNVNNKG